MPGPGSTAQYQSQYGDTLDVEILPNRAILFPGSTAWNTIPIRMTWTGAGEYTAPETFIEFVDPLSGRVLFQWASCDLLLQSPGEDNVSCYGDQTRGLLLMEGAGMPALFGAGLAWSTDAEGDFGLPAMNGVGAIRIDYDSSRTGDCRTFTAPETIDRRALPFSSLGNGTKICETSWFPQEWVMAVPLRPFNHGGTAAERLTMTRTQAHETAGQAMTFGAFNSSYMPRAPRTGWADLSRGYLDQAAPDGSDFTPIIAHQEALSNDAAYAEIADAGGTVQAYHKRSSSRSYLANPAGDGNLTSSYQEIISVWIAHGDERRGVQVTGQRDRDILGRDSWSYSVEGADHIPFSKERPLVPDQARFQDVNFHLTDVLGLEPFDTMGWTLLPERPGIEFIPNSVGSLRDEGYWLQVALPDVASDGVIHALAPAVYDGETGLLVHATLSRDVANKWFGPLSA